MYMGFIYNYKNGETDTQVKRLAKSEGVKSEQNGFSNPNLPPLERTSVLFFPLQCVGKAMVSTRYLLSFVHSPQK